MKAFILWHFQKLLFKKCGIPRFFLKRVPASRKKDYVIFIIHDTDSLEIIDKHIYKHSQYCIAYRGASHIDFRGTCAIMTRHNKTLQFTKIIEFESS